MDILKCYVIPFTGSKLKSTMIWINICCLSELLHDMTVDRKTVCQIHMGNVILKACACVCVFCACATIPSEIQSCDVPLIYTIPPNTPTEYLYWFLCYFYKIKNSAPSDIKTALIFFYVDLQWTKKKKKKMHFLFYSLLRTVTYSFLLGH